MRPPSQGWGKGKLPPPPLALPPAAAAPARRQRGAPGEAGGGGPRPQSRPQSPAPSRGSAGGAASPPSADAGGIIRRLRAAAWRYFGPFRRGCAALFFFFSFFFLLISLIILLAAPPPPQAFRCQPRRPGAGRAVPCRAVPGGRRGARRWPGASGAPQLSPRSPGGQGPPHPGPRPIPSLAALPKKSAAKRATCLRPRHRCVPLWSQSKAVSGGYFLSLGIVRKTPKAGGPSYCMAPARADFLHLEGGLLCKRALNKIDLHEA